MQCNVIWYPIVHHIISHHVMSYHIISYHIISYHIISYTYMILSVYIKGRFLCSTLSISQSSHQQLRPSSLASKSRKRLPANKEGSMPCITLQAEGNATSQQLEWRQRVSLKTHQNWTASDKLDRLVSYTKFSDGMDPSYTHISMIYSWN